MDITGNILLFPERKTDKKGNSFVACSTSITRKRADGAPLHKSMDVILDPANFPADKVAKLDPDCYYLFEVKKGWVMLDSYLDKAGNEITKFVVYVREGEPKEKKPKAKRAEKSDGGLW